VLPRPILLPIALACRLISRLIESGVAGRSPPFDGAIGYGETQKHRAKDHKAKPEVCSVGIRRHLADQSIVEVDLAVQGNSTFPCEFRTIARFLPRAKCPGHLVGAKGLR
jgi:hypothetical protein